MQPAHAVVPAEGLREGGREALLGRCREGVGEIYSATRGASRRASRWGPGAPWGRGRGGGRDRDRVGLGLGFGARARGPDPPPTATRIPTPTPVSRLEPRCRGVSAGAFRVRDRAIGLTTGAATGAAAGATTG